jgi:hypothetical protein
MGLRPVTRLDVKEGVSERLLPSFSTFLSNAQPITTTIVDGTLLCR